MQKIVWRMFYVIAIGIAIIFFFEAFALATVFHECKTLEDYMKEYTGQKSARPTESRGYYESFLKDVEAATDWKVVVDLTNKCIYTDDSGLYGIQSKEKPIVQYNMQNFGFEYYYIDEDGEQWPISLLSEYKDRKKKYEIIETPVPAVEISPENMGYVLKHCRIDYKDVDMDSILKMYLTSKEFRYHVSTFAFFLMERRAREIELMEK